MEPRFPVLIYHVPEKYNYLDKRQRHLAKDSPSCG